MKTCAVSLTMVGLLVSFTTAGTVYIEGPDDRGEGPLPQGGGEFTVDIYAEDFPHFAGLQIALQFIGPDGLSQAFTIPENASFLFQRRKVVHNDQVFPEIFGFCCGASDWTCEPEFCIPADVNEDGKVNVLDLVFIRNRLNQDPITEWHMPGDANGDDKVNILDLIFVCNRLEGRNVFGFMSMEMEFDPVYWEYLGWAEKSITQKTWLMTVTCAYSADAPPACTIAVDVEHTVISNTYAEAIPFDAAPASNVTIGEQPPPGRLIFEGPQDRGEWPVPVVPDGLNKCKVAIDVYGQGLFAFGRVQTALRFIHPDNGDTEFVLEEVVYNEDAFPDRFGVLDPREGIAGFVVLGGDIDLQQKTWLYSLTYAYTPECAAGEYTVEAHPENTFVRSGSGYEIPFEVDASPLTIRWWGWPIKGDVTMDCVVNVLDLIDVRNHMNVDPATGDNWGYDVNQDGKVNILDLVTARNYLNTRCDCE